MSLATGLLGFKAWPFSDYTMYSWSLNSPLTAYEFVGFTAQGREVRLRDTHIFFPANRNGINLKIRTMKKHPDFHKRLKVMLRYFLRRYNWIQMNLKDPRHQLSGQYRQGMINRIELRMTKIQWSPAHRTYRNLTKPVLIAYHEAR